VHVDQRVSGVKSGGGFQYLSARIALKVVMQDARYSVDVTLLCNM